MAEQEQAIGSQVGLLMRQPAREHEQEAPETQPAVQVAARSAGAGAVPGGRRRLRGRASIHAQARD